MSDIEQTPALWPGALEEACSLEGTPNAEIADVVTLIPNSWCNAAPAVAFSRASDVRALVALSVK